FGLPRRAHPHRIITGWARVTMRLPAPGGHPGLRRRATFPARRLGGRGSRRAAGPKRLGRSLALPIERLGGSLALPERRRPFLTPSASTSPDAAARAS